MTADDVSFVVIGILFLSFIIALAAPAYKAPPAKPKKTLS